MNTKRVQGKWKIPQGIYTTYGFLLVVMVASAGLLLTSKLFFPWGIIGIILPILTFLIYCYFDRKNKNWQQQCLIFWSELKKAEEEKSPDWIFHTIVG